MGGRRRIAAFVALVVTVALAATSCVLSGSWTAVEPPPPASGAEAELLDVACPTRDFCMAVGVEWSDDPGPSFVQTWDGTGWAPLEFVPFTGDLDFEVRSVDCGTPTSCAIGWNLTDGGNDEVPMFSIWNGTSWSQPPFPTVYDPWYSEIDCAPDGSCVLVTEQSPTIVWDGATFTTFDFGPTGQGVYSPWLVSLTCLSADDCVGITEDTVHRWDGSDWDDGQWFGQPLPDVPGSEQYRSITCTSTDRCLAVGFADGAPIAVVGDGTTWTPTAVPVERGHLRSVSCVNSAACVAIGHEYGVGVNGPVAVAWNGSTWYRVEDPPSPSATFNEISCGVGDRCMAVGSDYPLGLQEPFAAVYDWQASG